MRDGVYLDGGTLLWATWDDAEHGWTPDLPTMEFTPDELHHLNMSLPFAVHVALDELVKSLPLGAGGTGLPDRSDGAAFANNQEAYFQG